MGVPAPSVYADFTAGTTGSDVETGHSLSVRALEREPSPRAGVVRLRNVGDGVLVRPGERGGRDQVEYAALVTLPSRVAATRAIAAAHAIEALDSPRNPPPQAFVWFVELWNGDRKAPGVRGLVGWLGLRKLAAPTSATAGHTECMKEHGGSGRRKTVLHLFRGGERCCIVELSV